MMLKVTKTTPQIATCVHGAVTAPLFPPRPGRGGPAGSTPAVPEPHRHGDLREFFPDAVLHDAP